MGLQINQKLSFVSEMTLHILQNFLLMCKLLAAMAWTMLVGFADNLKYNLKLYCLEFSSGQGDLDSRASVPFR